MILYLIRHGQSANNVLAEEIKERPGPYSFDTYMKERVAEPPLTDLGALQAQRLGEHAHALPLTRLYCSPMLRTLQTAQPLARSLGIDASVWVELHEQGGVFHRPGSDAKSVGLPGLKRSEMSKLFPDYQLDSVGENGWWSGGEEDLPSCHARAIRVADRLHRMARELESDECIGAVSHGTFMDCLLKALLGRLPGKGLYFNHQNTGVTRVDFETNANGVTIFVRYTNKTGHLGEDQLTY